MAKKKVVNEQADVKILMHEFVNGAGSIEDIQAQINDANSAELFEFASSLHYVNESMRSRKQQLLKLFA